MNYQIYTKGDQSRPLVREDCSSDFAADTWARHWAATNGTDESYILRRDDGGYAASVFRTIGGQRYIMWLDPAK